MSAAQRRRLRRKKKIMKTTKKLVTGILLAPARIPRITGDKVDRIMRICEIFAISFVAVLMLHMAIPSTVGVGIVVAVGVVFACLLLLIGLSDYQDKLVEYELYGFKI